MNMLFDSLHLLSVFKAVLFHMKNQTTDKTVHTHRYEKSTLIAI